MESYIKDMKNLCTTILEFLEESDEHNYDKIRKKSFGKLIKVIKRQHIEGNGEEMSQFLEIIKSIDEHHHRDHYLNEGVNQHLFIIKIKSNRPCQIQKYSTFLKTTKKIVHFLIQKDIMTISDEICRKIVNKVEYNRNQYWHFFIPELENFVGEEKIKFVKNELLKNDPYDNQFLLYKSNPNS